MSAVTSAEQAHALVHERVLRGSQHDFVILTDRTLAKDYGWVVFYTTRRFAETGDPSALVPGTGPVVVTRAGEVVSLSTSVPPAVSIAAFEEELEKAQGGRPR